MKSIAMFSMDCVQMRPITPASRCRTAVVFPSFRQANYCPARHVKAFAHVDASMSKPKLLKLKKAELVEACQQKGVATSGTKEQLASNLLAFFEEGKGGEVNTAVHTDDVQLLTSRLADLDSAIQARTEELHSLHDSDRAAMEKLLAEVAGVKGTWQGKLNEISAVLEDVVTLKKGQLEFSKLNQQQEELQEELKVLSRMLKLREDEIKNLETQLEEVRRDRAAEKESVEAERLANVAVLALAVGRVAGGSSIVPVEGRRSMSAAPSYFPPMPTGPMPTGPKPMNPMPAGPGSPDSMGTVTATLPRSLPGPVDDPRPKGNVFGPAVPGLVFCWVLGQVHNVYAGARNSVLESQTKRTVVDACASAGLLATIYMASTM